MKNLISTLFLQLLCVTILQAQTFVAHRQIQHQAPIYSLKISPDGKWLAVTHRPTKRYEKISIYDVTTQKLTQTFSDESCDFSADNRFLLTHKKGSYSRQATIRKTDSWEKIRETDKVDQSLFSPGGKYWVTSTSPEVSYRERRRGKRKKSSIKFRVPATGLYSHTIDCKNYIYQMGCTPQYLITLGNRKFRVYSLSTGKLVQSFDNTEGKYSTMVVSPDNQHIVVNHLDKIELWNFRKGKKITTLKHNVINGLRFSPGGKYLIVGTHASTIIWNVAANKQHQTYSHHRHYTQVQYSIHGQYKVVVRDRQATLYEVLTNQKIQEFELSRKIKKVSFSDNNQYLAMFDERYRTHMWITGKRLKALAQERLHQWLQKGEFEKTADHKARITNQSQLKKKTQQFSQEIIQSQVSLDWKRSKLQYDADHELFKITTANYFHCYVKVPIKEAPQFKQDFQKFTFRPQFGFGANHQLVVASLTMSHPTTQRLYTSHNQPVRHFHASQKMVNKAISRAKITAPPSVVSSKPSEHIGQKLPKNRLSRPKAFAVVIGNQSYKKAPQVDFALHDAQMMKKYLTTSLGFKEGNIFYVENASKLDFELLFGNQHTYKGKLYNSIVPNKSEVFIFYAGHGAPDLNSKQAYFVPVDASPNYLALSGYATNTFYQNLAKLPAKSITIVLDACFSGATLNGSVFKNISPVEIKPKHLYKLKNAVLLSSSKGTQVSSWYNEKQHGLFTYFFLKALHHYNADFNKDKQITIKEVYRFIANQTEGVPYWARKLHGIEQTPTLQGTQTNRVLLKY